MGGVAVVLLVGTLAVVAVPYLRATPDKPELSKAGGAGSGPVRAPVANGPTARERGEPVIDGDNGNSIINEFIANPIAAEKKWLNQRVRFWNGVGKIDKDSSGWFIASAHCDITAHIAPDQAEVFGKLPLNSTIEVETTLNRFTMAGRGGTIPYLWGHSTRLVGIENEKYLKMGKDDPMKTYGFDEFRGSAKTSLWHGECS